MNDERSRVIKIAETAGLPRTQACIARCYADIMRTLVEEAGTERAIALLVEAKDPEWAYWFACNVPGLTEAQTSALIALLVEAKDLAWARPFACDVKGLTEAQKRQLRAVHG